MKISVKYAYHLIGVILALLIFWPTLGLDDRSEVSTLYAEEEQIGSAFISGNYLSALVDSPEVDLPYPIDDPADPTDDGGSGIDFEDPLNYEEGVEYDPETNSYLFNSTVDGMFDYQRPMSMSLDDYQEYDLNKALEENWENIVSEDNEMSKSTIPKLSVGNEKFKDIFGSNTIDIRPQGSAELTFGINTSRTDNPQIPEKQRRITTFDFDERIQLNVVGTIGDKLKLSTSYNTEATFDFENQMKLEYTGYEDEIIQKIEAGNVSLPLNGSLITGSQSLFGVKTELKFGRLSVTSVFSQQKGKRSEITVSGGAQVSQYELKADEYEANRHYFISQDFRNRYDKALENLPVVNSPMNITRIEVWVTNTNNTTQDTRNIIAMTDLGEVNDLQGQNVTVTGQYPENSSNDIYSQLSNNSAVRGFVTATSELQALPLPGPYEPAVHYEKVENARMLSPQEYSYNSQLGYISLNQALNNDEVLAVAFQYTIGDSTYQVGEFSTDGVDGQDALILKLLKPTITNPKVTLWDLMMKNVYAIGAYQVNRQNFQLNLWYNNPQTSVEIPFLPYDGVDDVPLIQVIGLDKLNQNNEAFPDGYFDFVPIAFSGNQASNGGTVNPQNGRIFFTTAEPFGSRLEQELQAAGVDQNTIDNVVYQELYDSTKIAAQNIPEKNRFYIKGSYESSSSSEISLNALNIPQGSVTVTAGGIQLVENQDYTVDYNLGRVKIINESYLESQTPIKVSLESNSLFNIQQKTLLGTHMDYKINNDANLGFTALNLTERPLTQKINIGDEPISNTVLGLDGNYRREVPYLTKLIDKLPFLETKEMSELTFQGELAYLIPGHSRAIGKEGISYIDDFEGSQSAIDIRSFNTWTLASVPKGQPELFPEGGLVNDLIAGYNRAKIAWYVIDPLFFRNNNLTPDHIADNPAIQEDHRMREVLQNEVFPNQQLSTGTPTNIPVFDVAYYPGERGPYNFDMDGEPGISMGLNNNGGLNDPETRWGGIMRQLTTNDFEAANVEFIQFWVMDPFNSDADPNGTNNGGDLYFNLGNVSEDILPDSRKAFENGIPPEEPFDPDLLAETAWGRVPTTQAIVNAFDNDLSSRILQDVGLDLLDDDAEQDFYEDYITWVINSPLTTQAKNQILNDPSNDNYNYYRDDDYDQQQLDVLERYKRYNGMEGNSPTSEMSDTMNADGYPTSATTLPNVEDINQDNNLSETESYFQYKVSIRPQDMAVGQNYITDELTVTDPNGKQITWYQFKIPVREPNKVVNGIQDFRSIRFIRMFMKGFEEPVVMRFARLELIRGEWRRYLESLQTPGEYIQTDPNSTVFNVSAVNVEQNGNRSPINYVVPPGIIREVDVSSPNLRQMNEQSLSFEVCGLRDGDARAAFKNVDFDVRQYKKLKMFIHGESRNPDNLVGDDEVTVFIRLGTDFEDNYYEYEVPVKITPHGTTDPEDIWPEANNMAIDFQVLKDLKKQRNADLANGLTNVALNQPYVDTDPTDPTRRITVIGNPNLQAMKTIMIGVRNPNKDVDHPWLPDDGEDKCVEIWVNELRLTDFNEEGGWAAQGRLSLTGADFFRMDLAGNVSTPNWGSIEKRVSERQRETIKQFDFSSTFELGKFFNEKWGIRVPMYLGYSVGAVDPQFDPLNPDIEFTESLEGLPPDERERRIREAQSFTQRKSLNFTNVSKRRAQGKTPHFWDVSNWSLTYAYNEIYRRDINTKHNINRTWRGALNYTFNPNPKPWKPFDNVELFRKSKWFRWIRDFNLFTKPKLLAFRNDINRTYTDNLIRSNFENIIQPQYNKQFRWNRAYDFKYDISRSLKFDFTALNTAIIQEPTVMGPDEIGAVDRNLYPQEYQEWKDAVMQSVTDFGETTNYGHTANINWNVPLNKIPLTDWITMNTTYSTSYDWQRAPFAQDTLGHTVQNSRNVRVNGQMNLVTLYNKIPYFKKINQKYGRGGRGRGRRGLSRNPRGGSKGDKDDEEDEEEEEKNKFNPLEHFARLVMSVKNISVNYSVTDGTLLPGYNAKTNYLGMDENFSAPGWDFIFGRQPYDLLGRETNYDFATMALRNDWIIPDTATQFLNTQHTLNHGQNISARATIEPFNGLRIELTADRNFNTNKSSNFRWDPVADTVTHQNLMETGMLSFSTITWGTAFDKIDDKTYSTSTFEKLRDNRDDVSNVLGNQNPNSQGSSPDDPDYADGYGGSQQDVIIGSFLTAYTGKNPDANSVDPFSGVPLPNWRITFDGLSKINFLKEYLQRMTISHGYRSNFSVANFTTNLQADIDSDGNPSARNNADNFVSSRQILTATLMEQFSPLIGVDATWNIEMNGKTNGLITKVEIKKDRNLSLSLTNNQVTEIRGSELVIGSGYKFADVPLPFDIGGNEITSDLNVRVDVSIRSNRTVTHKIVENQNQITSGQRLISIKSAADYQISDKLNIRLYFDRNVTTPFISTTFPTANTNAGIALRFQLTG